MTREQLCEKTLESLREIAKAQGVKSITKYRKAELIDIIMNGGVVPGRRLSVMADSSTTFNEQEVSSETGSTASKMGGIDTSRQPNYNPLSTSIRDNPISSSVRDNSLSSSIRDNPLSSSIRDKDEGRDQQVQTHTQMPPQAELRGGYSPAYIANRQNNSYQQKLPRRNDYVRTPNRPQMPRSGYQRRNDSDYGQQNDFRQNDYRQNDFRQNDYRQQGDYNPQGYYQQNGFYQQGYSSVQQDRYNNINQGYSSQNGGYQPSYRTPKPEGYYNAEYGTSNPAVPEMIEAGECFDVEGTLDLVVDDDNGYGFLRTLNYYNSSNDIYISNSQVRRFRLRTGDYVCGKARPSNDPGKFAAMMYITSINGRTPDEFAKNKRYEELVPVFPNERFTLETNKNEGDNNLAIRLIDLLAPIGRGQRGMIVSQPKAGKTTLLKSIARGIEANYPDVHLIVLLIDERPEEVTDMQRSIKSDVIYSTFDELPEHHTRVAELVQGKAMRLVEEGKDVVVLMDSITRLARAYNLTMNSTGKTLSGGMDPGALHKPKRFFGAARNIENGGSLTVIATALIETGSRMDDMVYEEFKGTGNMEIHLDRKLSEKRIFPAIDIYKSGTRRDDLLLSNEEQECANSIRRMLSGSNTAEVTEQVISMLEKTETNAEFAAKFKSYISAYEKSGFTPAGKPLFGR